MSVFQLRHIHVSIKQLFLSDSAGEQRARAQCLYYGSVHNYHRGTDYMYDNSGFSGTREAVLIFEVSIVRD